MRVLPARQIHLDFHTSEFITAVGARFDKKQYQAALQVGHVNSVNVIAKCHHSWSYYPTQVGKMHPHLSFDLLGAQIEACHEIGVRAPVYYTVGWSATDAEQHPEWTARAKDGTTLAWNYDLNAPPDAPKPPTSWKYLCPSGDYLELMLAQTRELCDRYGDLDGFWYDICHSLGSCYCERCLAGMHRAGLDHNDEAQAKQYYAQKWQRFQALCNELLFARHPQAIVFYNGMFKAYSPDYTPGMTHLELEDLPTTWGGYDKLPLRAKYYINKGKPLLAMSGKFHTFWGEFGGYKPPAAIRFEAATMIAFGVGCCFGDQLHPSGVMDMATYRNLGAAYEYVEQIEEYGPGGEMCANLGLWVSDQLPHDQGVVNMLLENQVDFEVVTPEVDLARYETIILTGEVRLTVAEAARLHAYVRGGGSLLVLAQSGLDVTGQRFLLDVGADYLGPAHYALDYLVVGKALAANLPGSPFLNYEAAVRVQPRDAEILATIKEPFFDRTYGRYCSHQNTPYRDEDAAHPGALRKGRVVYLPHALGKLYYDSGARVHRDLFINALRLIYHTPTMATQMPSAARVNLLHQQDKRRYVTHLLYSPPMQRGRCLVIEDMVPLYNVPLALRVPQTIRRAYLAPSGEALPLAQEGAALRVVVPKVEGHQIVVWEY